MMKILVDLQCLQTASGSRGMGRYSLSLFKEMLRLAPQYDFHILLNNNFPNTIMELREDFTDLLPSGNIHVFYDFPNTDILSKENDIYREVSEYLREAFIEQLKPDVIHIVSLFDGMSDPATTSVHKLFDAIPTVVTLYDLIPLLRQEWYIPNQGHKDWYFEKIENLKRADLLLSISQSSRSEALEFLGIAPSKICNISTAIDDFFKVIELTDSEKKSMYAKFGLRKKFLMGAGHPLDPRKNTESLIRAYSKIGSELRKEFSLLLVGGADHGEGFLDDLLDECGLSSRDVVFTGFVSDEELRALYNLCDLFVFPSFHEGFGLPVLEAMSCGAIVLGSNCTSIPEVIGDERAMFDPTSIEEITDMIKKALCDDSYRQALLNSGREQVKKFSWQATAEKALSAIENLVSSDKLVVGRSEAQSIEDELLDRLSGKIHEFSDSQLRQLSSFIARNRIPEKKQLLIDITALARADDKSGIQRVVRSVLNYFLNKSTAGYQVRAIYRDGHQYRYANHFVNELQDLGGNEEDALIDYYNGDIFLGADLDLEVVPVAEVIHHDMKQCGVRKYHIVYDIIPVKLSEYCHPAVVEAYTKVIDFVMKKADGAICISKAVADELREFMLEKQVERITPLNISHFHLGANVPEEIATTSCLSSDESVMLDRFSKARSFMMVGTIEARKAHQQVLDAFELRWAQGVEDVLILVGKEGWHVESLLKRLEGHGELNKRLYWLQGVSDDFLRGLYGGVTALIQASYGEGFGLPLIETAFYGTPIIARDLPVFREVAGDYAYYFHAKDGQEMAEVLDEWSKLYSMDKHPCSKGMPYLSWDQSVNQIEQVINVN